MLQKELNNEVPDTVLRQCPEADRILVENALRVAQAEIMVLNLAGTTICIQGKKISVKNPLTGPSPSVSLSSMRSLQAYSPSVLDLRTIRLQQLVNPPTHLLSSTRRRPPIALAQHRVEQPRMVLLHVRSR